MKIDILDGGLGSELGRRGVPIDPPLWSARAILSAPDVVTAIHRDYLQAGADILTTTSYQVTFEGFAREGFSAKQTCDVFRQSVFLAKQARDDYLTRTGTERRIRIAGSLGPFGAFLSNGAEYRGDYERTDAEYRAFHQPRIDALLDAGVDLIAFETFPNYREIQAVVNLLQMYKDVPAWISLSVASDQALADATPLAEVAGFLAQPKTPWAIGVNCLPPHLAANVVRRLRLATDKPILCYPNRGDTWDAPSQTWRSSPNSSASLASFADDWLAAGANLVGGCCQSTPEDIRDLTLWRDSLA